MTGRTAMKGIVFRLINKCRREVSKRTRWYKMQKQALFEVIHELETIDMSEDMQKNAVVQKLQGIGRNIILDNVSMANLPFIIYLLFYKYKGNIEIVHKKNDCAIKIGICEIARMSYLAVYIHFVDIKDNKLCIEGNVSWPTVLKDRCLFGVKNNGKSVECNMYEGGLDVSKGLNVYETRTAYYTEIPLETENDILFYNYVDGNECVYGKINSMRFAPVADCINNQYCVRNGWMLRIDGNRILCKKATADGVKRQEMLFLSEIMSLNREKADEVKSLRNEYFDRLKNKEKPIWIFMDRIHRADDNAEVLYKYVKEAYSDIDAYYVIKKDTSDYKRLSELGNIIDAGSREHKMLVLMADYIISSQANGIVENPFWDDAEYFRDLYHQAKIVFLQHGVTKDDMSITLNRYGTNFSGLITSSEREKASFIGQPCFYRDKEVWLTGMPRFDALYNNPQKYILLMPSWRMNLMEHVWDDNKNDMIWKVKEYFLQSKYVQCYNKILRDTKLKEKCEAYGYKLVFMPHALMEPYIDEFVHESHCIYWDSSKSYRDAFAEGDLLITDYSSVAFDFSYLEKPVIYYQFDREEFFNGHSYRKGYFDYEKDGFGEVVYSHEQLIDTIVNYMMDGCKLKEKYKNRKELFFAYGDNNCCRRVCDMLMEL